MADGSEPATPFDPLEQVVQQRIAEKQRQAVSIADAVAGGNPDQFANHMRLADGLGVPVDTVEALPQRAESLAKAKEISALFPSYKATGDFISDPVNMRLVNDDLETLRQTESIWKEIGQAGNSFVKAIGGIGADNVKSAALIGSMSAEDTLSLFDRIDRGGSELVQTGGIKGLFQINPDQSITLQDQSAPGGVRMLLQGTGDKLYDYIMNPPSRQAYREQVRRATTPETQAVYKAGSAAQKWLQSTFLTTPAFDESLAGQAAAGTGSVVGYLLTALANPGLAAAAGAGQGATAQYEDARRSGVDVKTARRAAGLGGVVGLSELLPAEALIAKFGAGVVDRALGRVAGRILVGTATEGTEEIGQQIASNFIAQQMYDAERSIWDGVISSGVGGASGGAFLGTLFGLLDRRGVHHVRRVEQALQSGDIIGASKLFSRNPQKAAEFVEKVAGSDQIFIPGETIKELFQADDGAVAATLAAQWGLTADQIAESLATGADIAVPVAQYVTRIQPTPRGQTLAEVVRVGEFGMSKREFQRYESNRDTLMADLSRQVGEVKQAVEPMRQVFDDVYSQLRLAGRAVTEARNLAAIYAARAETRAQRRGKGESALDVHQGNNLSIKLVLPESLQSLNDGQLSAVIAAAVRPAQDTAGGVAGASVQPAALSGQEAKGAAEGAAAATTTAATTTATAATATDAAPAAIPSANEQTQPAAPAPSDRQAPEPALDAIEGAGNAALVGAVRDLRALLNALSVDLEKATEEEVRVALANHVRTKAEGTGPTYSQDELPGAEAFRKDAAHWAKRLALLMQGQVPAGQHIRLGRVPAVLQAVGFGKGNLVMLAGKVYKVLRDHPEVPRDVFDRLPELLSDPLAVFPSGKNDGSYVVALDAKDTAANLIIAPIQKSGSGSDNQVASVVLSVYGREDADGDWLQRQIDAALTRREKVYLREFGPATREDEPGSDRFQNHRPEGGAVNPAHPIQRRVAPGVRARGNIVTRADVVKPATGMFYQSAWHGSPHSFDAFDFAHMGKGEGIQAFGWGGYVAGKKALAEYYRDTLANPDENPLLLDGQPIDTMFHDELETKFAPFYKWLGVDGRDRMTSLLVTLSLVSDTAELPAVIDGLDPQTRALYRRRVEGKLANAPKKNPGRLYAVDIPNDNELLAWDVPLSEQPQAIQDAVQRAAEGLRPGFKLDLRRTGQAIYMDLALLSGLPTAEVQKAASLALLNAGIPGHRYLNGETRSQGTSDNPEDYNYVIYDAGRMQITSYEQSERGQITFGQSGALVQLFAKADASTMLHETGHLWLEELIADAADASAPQQLKDDLASVLNWFGVLDPSQITVAHHEQWARGVERYLMEGKAPTAALQRIFTDFKRWLLRIYRTVTELRSPINDDVRRVMDRLLALDEEIAAARGDAGLRALFTEATADSMSKAEFEAYRQKVLEADAATNADLLGKVMADLLKRRTAEWQEAEKKERDAATEEVSGRPDFALIRYLRDGTWPNGDAAPEPRLALDRQALIDMYGGETFAVDEILKMIPAGTYRAEGVHPDMIAPWFGFASGRDMIEEMAAVQREAEVLKEAGDLRTPQQKAIDDLVEARMQEAFGAPPSTETIREEAEAAIRNGPQEELLATELRILARKANRQPTPLQLAKDWAAEQIAGRRVADVTTIQHYARAEAKAARDAEAALLAGKFDEAFDAKRRQLLNMLLHREAKKAADAVGRAVERLQRYASARVIKGLDPDYLDQIHALLARFNLTRLSRAQVDRLAALGEWAAAQQDAGIALNVPGKLLDQAYRVHYTKMTVADLLDLKDAADQLAHLGKLKGKLLKAQKDREIDRAAEEMLGALLTNVPAHGRLQGSWQDRNLGWLRGFLAEHRKLENLAIEFDGGKRGPWWHLLYKPLSDAAEEEATQARQAGQDLKALFAVYSKAERKAMAEPVTVPMLGRVMTKWDLLALALNMGNQGNIEAIEDGNGYKRDDVMRLLASSLTKKDWDFVQSVWDYVDTFWPEIAALERRMTGVVPAKVEATPVMTPFGVYRGGYYPLKGDAEVSSKKAAEDANERYQQMLGGGISRAATRHGHTKERIGFGKTPVKLDIGVLFGHAAAVLHDLTHREAVVDVHRLATRLDVTEALNATAGREVREILDRTVRAVAGGEPEPNTKFMTFIRYLRGGYVISRLGLNVANALQNFTGLAPAMALVGEKRMVMHGIPFLSNPVAIGAKLRAIASKSPMMADRLRSSSRDMRDVINSMDSRKELRETAKRWVMGLTAYTDLAVAGATWTAAYNQAFEGEADAKAGAEADAIAYADSVVRRALGAGYTKDLADIQRGHEAVKLLTTFLGYFINIFNMNVDQIKGLRRGQINPLRFAFNMLWINTIPALLGDFILTGGPPDDDDERLKAWGKWAATSHLRWLAGGVVGLRDIVSAWAGWAPQTAYAAFLEANKNLATQLRQGEVDRSLTRSALNLVGPLVSLPTGQVFKTGDGLTRWLDGEDLSAWEALFQPPPMK
jgi:hypothetical protein